MKYFFKKIILVVFIFICNNNLSQNNHNIEAVFLISENKLKVKQVSVFRNNTAKNLNKIFIYDFNNSFSSIDTPLSKKLYSEYDSSLLKSDYNQKGRTLVSKILVGNEVADWNRVNNQQDIIEIKLLKTLEKNLTVKVVFEYELILPNYTNNYGNKDFTFFNLKNCFFRFLPFINNDFLKNSNLGLDDQLFQKSEIKLDIKFNSSFNLTSNLTKIKTENLNDFKNIFFKGYSMSDINLIFSKENKFKKINLDKFDLYSDSDKILNLKKDNLSNINSFSNNNFNKIKNLKSIVLDNNYFKKHSLLPYSEIPSIFDPFETNTLNEINLIKNIIKLIIKNSSNFDFREMFWLYSGLELYYLEKYIDKYHNDLSLIGKFSNLFFIKRHNISLNKFKRQFELKYNFVSARNLNQSIYLSSDKLTRINYTLSNPSKSLKSLNLLRNYIGSVSFNKSVSEILFSQKQVNNIFDLEELFENNTNLKLDWFFKKYIKSDKLIDFKIYKKDDNFIIKNILDEDLSFPIPVKIEYLDNTIKNIWVDQTSNKSEIVFDKNIRNITVDPNRLLLDETYKNNKISNVKKNKIKTKVKFFSDIDDLNFNQIFYRPQFIYNLYDGFSPGITFTNKSPFKKRFTYLLSPYYAINSKKIVGNVNLNYTAYNSKTFSSNYYLSLSKFNYDLNKNYFRFSPTIIFTKRDKDLVSNHKQFLRLKYIGIRKSGVNNDYGISRLTYINTNPGAKKSISFNYDLQLNNQIIKNSITFNYRNYFSDFRQFNIRLFIGKFFKNDNESGIYNFSVDRSTDYLYNNYLLGRSEQSGFYSQQYLRYEGAFKSKINESNPNDFILSINSGITLWKWFEAYLDYGLFRNKSEKINSGFDSGLRVNLVENYFELFFPVYSSEGYYLNDNSYSNKIRFILTFDIDNLSSLFTRRWF